jgi:hypothetical protein
VLYWPLLEPEDFCSVIAFDSGPRHLFRGENCTMRCVCDPITLVKCT